MELAALTLVLGFAVSILSGLLGIGGGIVMAPAMLRHRQGRQVDGRLVFWMGGTMVVSALAGSVASRWIADTTVMAVFAGMAAVAALLMMIPRSDEGEGVLARDCSFDVPAAVAIALAVGFLGGMVGQGGSFLLIPLMLHVQRLPTRVAIGSNVGIVLVASMAGFAGKLGTGQVPLLPAATLVIGAVAGAYLGSVLSLRTHPAWLRRGLAVVVALMAVGIGGDAAGLY
jgi:uncharacterized membrane protein YfcA